VAIGIPNKIGYSPIQIAATKCQLQNLELFIKFVRSCDDADRRKLVSLLLNRFFPVRLRRCGK
jgi:hypothetical protein